VWKKQVAHGAGVGVVGGRRCACAKFEARYGRTLGRAGGQKYHCTLYDVDGAFMAVGMHAEVAVLYKPPKNCSFWTAAVFTQGG
jgi:hypothetical protein